MNNLVIFSVTAPAEVALKKLAKANIPVYRLKKQGNTLTFGVSHEYLEKVFAIFKHSCYNVRVVKQSSAFRFARFIKRRFGFVVGAVMFCTLAVLSGSVIIRVKVTGNGSYLSREITSIAQSCGVKPFTFCRNMDVPSIQAKVMALPNVSFCSVQRSGAYLVIDVHTETEQTVETKSSPLKATLSGEVYRIVAICGTAERAEGESVSVGDVLIGAYYLTAEGERVSCLAVGFADIAVKASISLYYQTESEESEKDALAATALYSDRVLEKSFKVSPFEEGFKYEVTFRYLVTVAVNME